MGVFSNSCTIKITNRILQCNESNIFGKHLLCRTFDGDVEFLALILDLKKMLNTLVIIYGTGWIEINLIVFVWIDGNISKLLMNFTTEITLYWNVLLNLLFSKYNKTWDNERMEKWKWKNGGENSTDKKLKNLNSGIRTKKFVLFRKTNPNLHYIIYNSIHIDYDLWHQWIQLESDILVHISDFWHYWKESFWAKSDLWGRSHSHSPLFISHLTHPYLQFTTTFNLFNTISTFVRLNDVLLPVSN